MILKNKPVAFRKFKAYLAALKKNQGRIGHYIRGLIINRSNQCNFKCEHCFTSSARGDSDKDQVVLTDLSRICNELHELGAWEVEIQGGEPLLMPDLGELLCAVNVQNFLIVVTTNGWLLSKSKAKQLLDWGVDRVGVSIDSFDAQEHDCFRGVSGAYSRALSALRNVQEAGIVASINYTVGHHNVRSKNTEKLITYAEAQGYLVNMIPLTPTGCMQGRFDLMLTAEDSDYLKNMKLSRSSIFRDLWSIIDSDENCVCGCPAVNILYMNPHGDILPCPFIQASLGNIRSSSLKEIVARGFSIEHFSAHHSKCLAGENISFARDFLQRQMSVMQPISYKQLFLGNQESGEV